MDSSDGSKAGGGMVRGVFWTGIANLGSSGCCEAPGGRRAHRQLRALALRQQHDGHTHKSLAWRNSRGTLCPAEMCMASMWCSKASEESSLLLSTHFENGQQPGCLRTTSVLGPSSSEEDGSAACASFGAGFGAAFGFAFLARLLGGAGGGKYTCPTIAEEELAERCGWDGSKGARPPSWTTSDERTDCMNSPPRSIMGTFGAAPAEPFRAHNGPGRACRWE